jgi:proline dehydrogenase
VLRRTLLAAAGSTQLERLMTSMPVSNGIVTRFVAGESAEQAVAVSTTLVESGLQVSLDRLGEDVTDESQAAATVEAYGALLRALRDAGLTPAVEVSVKLSAVGQALGTGGAAIALDNAKQICAAAKEAGTTVTIDMEDHTTTDATLDVLAAVRRDYPDTGAVVQAYLRRTEADCKELAVPGSRVRLCKGAYAEPESVAFSSRAEVDKSYVRCLKVLMAGPGYPMVATHDPRLVRIAGMLAGRAGREPSSYEYQMLYGVRPAEQKRLAEAGETVRVYTPYGDEWYGYLMRRLAERPQNVAFFARSLVSKG